MLSWMILFLIGLLLYCDIIFILLLAGFKFNDAEPALIVAIGFMIFVDWCLLYLFLTMLCVLDCLKFEVESIKFWWVNLPNSLPVRLTGLETFRVKIESKCEFDYFLPLISFFTFNINKIYPIINCSGSIQFSWVAFSWHFQMFFPLKIDNVFSLIFSNFLY